MTRQRKITYCLLLGGALVLLFAAGLLGVGSARANYKNAAFWNTIIQPETASTVSSDCLIPEGQTVVLGTLKEERTIDIQFWSEQPMQGVLDYEILNREDRKYVGVELFSREVFLSEEKTSVSLCLTPKQEVSETQKVDILVTLEAGDQVLQGTFRVILPAKVEEVLPDTGYGTSADTNTGGIVTPDTGYGSSIDTRILRIKADTGYGSSADTSNGIVTPDTGYGGSADTNSGVAKPDTGYNGSVDTEEVPETVYERLGSIDVDALEDFSINSFLPMVMELPEDYTSISIGLSKWQIPAYTRYSADGGESWFMLYDGGLLKMDAADTDWAEEELCLLLDLSRTSWPGEQKLEFEVKAYTDEGWYTGSAEAVPHVVLFGTRSAKTPLMLSADRPLALALPEGWEDCEYDMVLERLTVQQEDTSTAVFQEMDLDDRSIQVDFLGDAVSVSVGNVLPQAGTYRLSIAYYYSGVCFAQTQITFFVNYSGDT